MLTPPPSLPFTPAHCITPSSSTLCSVVEFNVHLGYGDGVDGNNILLRLLSLSRQIQSNLEEMLPPPLYVFRSIGDVPIRAVFVISLVTMIDGAITKGVETGTSIDMVRIMGESEVVYFESVARFFIVEIIRKDENSVEQNPRILTVTVQKQATVNGSNDGNNRRQTVQWQQLPMWRQRRHRLLKWGQLLRERMFKGLLKFQDNSSSPFLFPPEPWESERTAHAQENSNERSLTASSPLSVEVTVVITAACQPSSNLDFESAMEELINTKSDKFLEMLSTLKEDEGSSGGCLGDSSCGIATDYFSRFKKLTAIILSPDMVVDQFPSSSPGTLVSGQDDYLPQLYPTIHSSSWLGKHRFLFVASLIFVSIAVLTMVVVKRNMFDGVSWRQELMSRSKYQPISQNNKFTEMHGDYNNSDNRIIV